MHYHTVAMASEHVTLAPVIDYRYGCFRLRVGQSKIHGLGLYADEDIPAHHKVIEHTAGKISPHEAALEHILPFRSG